MEKRFKFDPSLIKGTPIIFAVGFLLMSVPLITRGEFTRLGIFLGSVTILLILFWAALAYGTYVAVDTDKRLVRGKVLFIPGRKTNLSEVVSVRKRFIMGGLMFLVLMDVRKENGKLAERGLVNGMGLKKGGLKELLETIRSINPKIEIPEDLTK